MSNAPKLSILNDEEKLKDVMKKELRGIKNEYATPRKTEIKEEKSISKYLNYTVKSILEV